MNKFEDIKKELNAIANYANNCVESYESKDSIRVMLKKLLFEDNDENFCVKCAPEEPQPDIYEYILDLYCKAKETCVYNYQFEEIFYKKNCIFEYLWGKNLDDKNLDDKNVIISSSEFIKVAIGCIYEIAPSHKPRKIDKIVEHIENYFTENDISRNNWKQIGVDINNLKEFVKDVFKDCKEFEELNLSQEEYDKGIKVDDENRPKFNFVTAFSEPSLREDFIDLDALYQNIVYELKQNIKSNILNL